MNSPNKTSKWAEEFNKMMSEKDTIEITHILFDGKNHSLTSVVNSDKIKSFISNLLLEILEEVEGEKKEQLDKNDPDNYGACYAIAGFNDALTRAGEIIREKTK